jgi:predicted nucleic acid-binding protein
MYAQIEGFMKMRVYLDNCCFNRPFDDQTQVRIRLETESKLEIQQRIKDKIIELAWSYVLDYENQANPFEEQRETIARWRTVAITDVEEVAIVLHQAKEIMNRGVRAIDALHLACAITAGCEYFLTTDDMIVRRMQGFARIDVINPTRFIIEVE